MNILLPYFSTKHRHMSAQPHIMNIFYLCLEFTLVFLRYLFKIYSLAGTIIISERFMLVLKTNALQSN